MAVLKPGAVVTVYEDPVTRETPEGEAELLRFELADVFEPREYWLVHFLDDPADATFYRWISTEGVN